MSDRNADGDSGGDERADRLGRPGRRAGGDAVGPSGDGDVRTEPRRLVADGAGDRPPADGVEDRTAADVFADLRAGSEPSDPESVLEESPAEIIESADEPTERSEPDDDLLDEDELEELLLTGRTEEYGFLWIDGDSDDGDSAPDVSSSTGDESRAEDASKFRDGAPSDVAPADADGSLGGIVVESADRDGGGDRSSDGEAPTDGPSTDDASEGDGSEEGANEDVGRADETGSDATGDVRRGDGERDGEGEIDERTDGDDPDDDERETGDADGDERETGEARSEDAREGRGVLSAVRSIIGRGSGSSEGGSAE